MSLRRDLEKRAQEAILKNIIENYKQSRADWMQNPAIRRYIFNKVFFKPVNAVIIAAAILAAGCFPLVLLPILAITSPLLLLLGAVGPIILGLVAEAVFLIMSFRNEEAHAEAVAAMLRPEINFRPETIQDKKLQSKVDKALEYWSLIDDAVETVPADSSLRQRLEHTTREVTNWLQAVYNLADRVDRFNLNQVIKQDLETVPRAIADYKRKLAKEDSPEVREQLERTIADKERQLRILQNLEDNMETASYQLDSTISSLGTIYSQLLLVGSKDESGSRVNRLQEEISEQVHRLEDLTEAMDEVYERST